jgi:hypothetical protein
MPADGSIWPKAEVAKNAVKHRDNTINGLVITQISWSEYGLSTVEMWVPRPVSHRRKNWSVVALTGQFWQGLQGNWWYTVFRPKVSVFTQKSTAKTGCQPGPVIHQPPAIYDLAFH